KDSNAPLNSDNYSNISNPQMVYAQVIDDTTGCFTVAQLSLEVSITQLLDYQAPFACDELDSEDGINSFNLNDFETDMQTLNGITFPISFYGNYQDAPLAPNALRSPYANRPACSGTMHARAEATSACYGI